MKVLVKLLKKCFICCCGLMVCALGAFLQIQAGTGLYPWYSLSEGMANVLNLSFGQAHNVVSVIIVVIDLIIHEAIGIGSILNAFVIGWGTDLFNLLFPFSTNSMLLKVLIVPVSLFLNSIGMYLYIGVGLGAGPRDTFLIGLGKRIKKISLGTVSIILFAILIGISYFMHATIGIGTLIAVFANGPIMDATFKMFKFKPYEIKHENLLDTIKSFKK